MNRLSLYSFQGNEKKKLHFVKNKEAESRTYTASGDFGKVECLEFRQEAASFQLIHMMLNSEMQVCFLAGKGTPLLNYCMRGHFHFQIDPSHTGLIAQTQASLHYNQTNSCYSYSAKPAEDQEFLLLSMTISTSGELNDQRENIADMAVTSQALTSTIGFQKEISGILCEIKKPRPEAAVLIAHAHLSLLEFLEQSQKMAVFEQNNSPEKRMVYLLAEGIIMGMDEPCTIKTLAGSKKMNPDRVKVLFKKHMHKPVTVFKIFVRMQKATQLLKETSKSIQEISMLVGYSNHASFSAMFKRKKGCSPSDFRRRSINPDGTSGLLSP
jgi:AraC-like DNA-binding protein